MERYKTRIGETMPINTVNERPNEVERYKKGSVEIQILTVVKNYNIVNRS